MSRIELFEHKQDEYFALGLRDGSVIIKPSGAILSHNVFAHVQPVSEKGEEVDGE